MVSHKKILKNVLLTLGIFLRFCTALDFSCIKYETFQVTDYKMRPDFFYNHWFRHSVHYAPQKITRIAIRSRRVQGCCELGYEYHGFPIFDCQPICNSPCPKNSYCSAPGQCSCNAGSSCVSISNETTTEEYIETTTIVDTTSVALPCNGSCAKNEECSTSDDVCICSDGFQRYKNDTCVPKCEPKCQHADCTAPNTCTCWPHYAKTNDGSCHLQCTELSCIYGECNENGTCVCAQGFQNNGTACVWMRDAILSEPDDCNCWSKFIWQKNSTDITGHHCLPLCDGDDSIEVTSECINFKHCQCYEGFLVCHDQMYKCSEGQEPNTTGVASTTRYLAQQVDDKDNAVKLTIIISTFLVVILAVGAILWIWQKHRSWFNQVWGYNHMTSEQI